jgi:spore coat polysaccharide biosynthesis predicted glycosyltransferase SpsG
MAEVMQSADLAISSGGRSVTELMTVGVPTIVMCQNRRELLHTHASMAYGVMNLGLGRFVAGAPLERTLRLVIEDVALRRNMQQLMLNATRERSNHAIIERIERRLGIN